MPTAVYPRVDAGAITAVSGVTAIDCSLSAFTVNTVDPVTAPNVALMSVVPAPTPVALPAPLMVATPGWSDAHVASPFRLCVLPSLNVPVAVYASFVPTGIDRPTGVTEIDTIVASVTTRVAESLIPFTVAVIFVLPGASPFARPQVAPTVATPVFDDVHPA